MSDGNYNRALLPKNPLAAGIRAGKAQMRTHAEQAFLKTIDEKLPNLSTSERQQLLDTFMNLLRRPESKTI